MKTKPITKKNKVMINSTKFMAEKTKKPQQKKKNLAKVKSISKVKLFCRALIFVMILLLMFGAYIYIEGTAQAAIQKTSSSPMLIVYKFYNGQATHYKKKIVIGQEITHSCKKRLFNRPIKSQFNQ